MKQREELSHVPKLETNRLILRKITLKDADDMYEYAKTPDVSKYVNWNPHKSPQDAREYILSIYLLTEESEGLHWAIVDKESGKMIGTIELSNWKQKHRCAEISYILSQDYWGKGLVPEAFLRIIEFAFEEINLVRIQARCTSDNTGSERVMQKCGMEYEGIQRKALNLKGKNVDVKLYSIINE